MGPVAANPASRSRGPVPTWLPLVAIAGGLLLAIELLDALLALPLRALSASVASFLLNSVSFPVQRQGTVLVAENFQWDVVPACSGSTSLRVLLTAAVVWCGIQPRLSWPRKLLCILGAIPLALLANGIRVAALTYVGTIQLRPVEGLLHNVIGVASLMLGMGAVVLLTTLMTSDQQGTSRRSPLQGGLLLALLLLLYAPALTWMLYAWRVSPLDRGGLWYWLAGIGALSFVLWKHPRYTAQPRLATVLFALSLLVLVLATIVSITFLKAAALLLSWFALVVYFRGWQVALCALPAFLICYLGLPTIVFQWDTVARALGLRAALPAEALRAMVAVLAIAVACYFAGRARRADVPVHAAAASMMPLLGLAFVGAVAQVYYFNSVSLPRTELGLELSHFQGEWSGTNLPVSGMAKEVIGAERILSRRYTQGDRWVEVLVSSTGGERRRAHAPEYCMTGSGWRIKERRTHPLTLPSGPVEVTLMTLERAGYADRQLAFWFADGEQTLATFTRLLGTDAARRLRGQITDWYVFRLIAPDQESLTAFARELQFTFRPVGTVRADPPPWRSCSF